MRDISPTQSSSSVVRILTCTTTTESSHAHPHSAMSRVIEFIYFKVKPSVKPEDPSNAEGEALLNVFHGTKHESGYQGSAWGRSVEDEDMIVWAVGESHSHMS